MQYSLDQGWAGTKNGELISLAEKEFDLFITADRNLRYQQNLAERTIAILELTTNDLRRIQAASNSLRSSVASTIAKEYRILEIP
ncbi:hypothetical protein KBB96_04650 [Luteolibacter ambystomatis]|uniref:DUF5615 domain-containing protein n=1 Tax=Luteolibacter ambystomatis TaxID=2824561 RepID=A0A975J195_9BACT|nr:hypothetical protein [Luteolibacter ambystomatis]QUE52183.1 hypothetical protein KBB96_04650 [Luteolibacter ambystomatis]